jgi:hypothetical protein
LEKNNSILKDENVILRNEKAILKDENVIFQTYLKKLERELFIANQYRHLSITENIE